MKNFRQHAIGYIASMMWEATTGYRPFSEVVRQFSTANERDGFEIEYIPRGLPPGNWLRIEGVRLTPEEMAEAISRAKGLLEGN